MDGLIFAWIAFPGIAFCAFCVIFFHKLLILRIVLDLFLGMADLFCAIGDFQDFMLI